MVKNTHDMTLFGGFTLQIALNEKKRYGFSMIVMHWLMVAGILSAFAMGLYMVDIPGITPLKLKLFNWHKWLGVTLFVLVLGRIIIRYFSKLPRYPAHWGYTSIRLIKLGHLLLYVLMCAVPVFGYLYSLAAGFPVVWFGVIELPVLIERNAQLKEVFEVLHEFSAKGLIVLVAGHALMALKHHFADQEGVLGRMIPGMKSD